MGDWPALTEFSNKFHYFLYLFKTLYRILQHRRWYDRYRGCNGLLKSTVKKRIKTFIYIFMEYNSYSNQYVHAFLIAQLVKNSSAMQEILVWFLGWEDPLEKGTAIHSSSTGLENSMDCIVHGVAKSWTGLNDFHLQDFHDQGSWKPNNWWDSFLMFLESLESSEAIYHD